ncbi:MAG: hypothetical protein ACR2M1_05265 [Gemmatimonadaceae bacterium]
MASTALNFVDHPLARRVYTIMRKDYGRRGSYAAMLLWARIDRLDGRNAAAVCKLVRAAQYREGR